MKKIIRLTETQLEEIVRKVIHEQEVQEQVSVRMSKPIDIFKRKVKERKTIERDSLTPETPEEEWTTFVSENEAPLLKLMNSSSKRYWTQIKENELELAVSSIESFNDTVGEGKWNNVYCGKAGTEKEEVPREPIVYPTEAMKFPANSKPSQDFFVDNHYETTDVFKNLFEADVVKPLTDQAASMQTPTGGKPKMFLKDLIITTSCSTLPNGQSPDGKTYTFKELSQKRNDSALAYIKEKLSSIGVLIDGDTKITQEFLGENGDGTSGPKWTGKDADRPKYEQYKILDVELGITLNIPPSTQEDAGVDIITTQLYKVIFRRYRGINLSIRIPIFEWNKRRRRKPQRVKRRHDACPKF